MKPVKETGVKVVIARMIEEAVLPLRAEIARMQEVLNRTNRGKK